MIHINFLVFNEGIRSVGKKSKNNKWVRLKTQSEMLVLRKSFFELDLLFEICQKF